LFDKTIWFVTNIYLFFGVDTKHMTAFILFQSLNSSIGNCHRNGV